MECLLCTIWDRMPYGKRHTSPTTTQETEGALIIGYWIASRYDVRPICERHIAILEILDRQEERRIEIEKVKAEEGKRLETFRKQAIHLHERKQSIIEASKAEGINPIIPIDTSPVIPMEQLGVILPTLGEPSQLPSNPSMPQEFKLGPGPLTNDNIITQQPSLPVELDPAQPYRPKAQPGTVEGALEAALLPPIEGAKVNYPCPSCGVEVVTGDVHAC